MWSQIYVLTVSSKVTSASITFREHLKWCMWFMGMRTDVSVGIFISVGSLLAYFCSYLISKLFIKNVPTVFFILIYNTKTLRYFISRDLNNICKHFQWDTTSTISAGEVLVGFRSFLVCKVRFAVYCYVTSFQTCLG